MLSSKIIELMSKGKTVRQSIMESLDNPDVYDDPRFKSYINSSMPDDIEYFINNDLHEYESKTDLFSKIETVDDLKAYKGSLEVSFELQLNREYGDTYDYYFEIIDPDLDALADELKDNLKDIEDESSLDYSYDVSILKYYLDSHVFINDESGVQQVKDLVDQYNHTGEDPRKLVSEIEKLPFVTEINFVSDFDSI